ncbi:MAG TPA: hypothetical protein PK771_02665, partial [Spirochaetota bacterium]|nr:hypothetical protein [Spirochaetota bacterium]
MDKNDTWGIDLKNRIMKYEPWLTDIYGKYTTPTEEEKDKIYGVSGEAIKESLLYFEECGGDTGKLIELLNTHIINNKFKVDRNILLDESRWYNNEYYFYFQMFCKKLIGRYDWHFGEGKNKLLSRYHKIYEKGMFKFTPFGGKFKHVNHAIIHGFVDYYKTKGIDFYDYFEW